MKQEAEKAAAEAARQKQEADQATASARSAAASRASRRRPSARDQGRRRSRNAKKARQAAAQAESPKKAQLRAQLLAQLNSILQTRDSARGLIVNMSDVLSTPAVTRSNPARAKARENFRHRARPCGLSLQIEGHTDSVGAMISISSSPNAAPTPSRFSIAEQGVVPFFHHRPRLRQNAACRFERHRRRPPAQPPRRNSSSTATPSRHRLGLRRVVAAIALSRFPSFVGHDTSCPSFISARCLFPN